MTVGYPLSSALRDEHAYGMTPGDVLRAGFAAALALPRCAALSLVAAPRPVREWQPRRWGVAAEERATR